MQVLVQLEQALRHRFFGWGMDHPVSHQGKAAIRILAHQSVAGGGRSGIDAQYDHESSRFKGCQSFIGDIEVREYLLDIIQLFQILNHLVDLEGLVNR
jgi:hypothetical protein